MRVNETATCITCAKRKSAADNFLDELLYVYVDMIVQHVLGKFLYCETDIRFVCTMYIRIHS